MSSQLKRHPGRALALLTAMIAVSFMFATLAAAQDRTPAEDRVFDAQDASPFANCSCRVRIYR